MELSRREFGSVIAASGLRVNADTIRMGFIGVGNRGSQVLAAARAQPDVEIVAFSDVFKPYLDRARAAHPGAQTFEDYRKLLALPNIDAVAIATPDHWHALMAVDACRAGKDVYVEKPLTLSVTEGRKIVEAARKYQRIVQVGLQRRSSPLYTRIREVVRSGVLGKITVARAYRINNMAPSGIGHAVDGPLPLGLNWDLWLGPRPERPFRSNIAPYKFRWWQAYSSQIGNWGVHYFDVIRWMLDERAPVRVACLGGKYAVDDDRTIPDTCEVICEFATGRLLVFGQYEASGSPALKARELELRGTLGTLYADTNGYEIIAESDGQFQSGVRRATPVTVLSPTKDTDLDKLHMRNFVDCVKSRAVPHCEVEEGHRSTCFAHLANIALATRSVIEWDADAERIVGNARASTLLTAKYRKPWKLEP